MGYINNGQSLNNEIIHEEDINESSVRNTTINALGNINDDSDDDDELNSQVAVLEKNEVCSPGFVIRRQRNAVESFAWDPNYASDIIEMGSMNRSLFLKEE